MSGHIITRDDLISHLEAERWERYASAASGHGAKSLDFSTQRQFRVTISGQVTYIGQSPTDAVEAYNAAP